jgi:hypothetical protein
MNKYGTWANGPFTNPTQFNQLLPYITGVFVRFPWSKLETAPGVYDWATFDAQMNLGFDNNLQVGFIFWVGPDAPITGTNTWLAQAPYSVPTFTNSIRTYPYYLNANYITRYYSVLAAIVTHLDTYPQWKKDLLMFWNSGEGTTGDEGPYHGTVPAPFVIPDADWGTFKENAWNYLYSAINGSSFSNTRLLYNTVDTGQYFCYSVDNTPTAFIKAGSFSHTYSNYGDSGYKALRLDVCRTYPTDEKRVRGEFEFTGQTANTWWGQSPTQNYFALCCSGLNAGLDMINIAPSVALSYGYIANPYPLTFFTKYAGVRDASETNQGFCVDRDILDINDTTRFPTGTYGIVIDKNISEYNAQLNNINSSDLCDAQKAFKRSNLIIRQDTATTYRYLSTTRIAAIQAQFPGSSYHFMSIDDNGDDKYTQDMGVDLIPGNLFRFVEEYSPNTNSKGVWRVGPTSSYFGRYARSTDVANGKTQRWWTVDVNLDNNGATGNNVTISFTYLNTGKAFWGIKVYTLKGVEEVMSNQNSNTNEWITKSITFDGFLFGGNLTHATDITFINYSTQDVITQMIEFKNNSKTIG